MDDHVSRSGAFQLKMLNLDAWRGVFGAVEVMDGSGEAPQGEVKVKWGEHGRDGLEMCFGRLLGRWAG